MSRFRHLFYFRQIGVSIIVSVALNGATVGYLSADDPDLKGIVNMPDKSLFSLLLPGSGRALWLEIGDSRNGLRVIAFDSKNNTLEVEYLGERKHLALAEADDKPFFVRSSRPLTEVEKEERQEALKERPAVRRAKIARPPERRMANPAAARTQVKLASSRDSVPGDRNIRASPDSSEARPREAISRSTGEKSAEDRHVRRLPRRKKDAGDGSL
ncbi:MAG: hypothetical protein R6U56_08480 [Opitutales bacterium]